MGVLGLWQILESVGHPIKLEGLEGKRLGVDANVWLYKFIRGFREKDNVSSIDSHKLGLFNRISKLLFYKIKPIFVFDGPAPVLKRRTLERRQNVRNKQLAKVQDTAMKLIAEQLQAQYPDAKLDNVKIPLTDLRSHNLVAAEKFTDEDRELFYLPPEEKTVEEKVKDEPLDHQVYHIDSDDDLQEVDIHSEQFAQLPAEVRYELLKDIKESRRRLRRADPLPDDAGSFSNFQMERLRSRRIIQAKMEECEKEICSSYTGDTDFRSYRIQSDPTSTMLYIQNKKEEFQQGPKVKPVQKSHDSALEQDPARPQPKPQVVVVVVEPSSSREIEELHKLQQEQRQRQLQQELEELQKLQEQQRLERQQQELERLQKESQQPKQQKKVIHEVIELNDSHDLEEIQEQHKQKRQKQQQQKLYEVIELDDSHELEEIQENQDKQKQQQKLPDVIELDESHEIEELHEQQQQHSPRNEHDKPRGSKQQQKQQDVTWLDESRELEMLQELHEQQKQDSQKRSEQHQSPEPELLLKEPQQPAEQSQEPERESSSQPLDLDDRPQQAQYHERQSLSQPIQSEHSPQQSYQRPQSQQPLQSHEAQQAQQTQRIQREASASQQVGEDGPSYKPNQTNKVTSKIVEEAKELLRLFGIPYIDAAGEAEAQCALLENLKLTEGTITDDSDVWLFGAQNVYRYFFSDDKYVMQYKMTDIEYHIRMTRENLVCFAMLVGSDYTDGIMNVGPVNAVEILSEFPGPKMEPLIKYKNYKLKYESSHKDRRPGSRKREKLLKFRLPDEFPSQTVFDGYMRPLADSSSEQFTWGTPELDELREYARRNFGWDIKKIDDKLLPVMKKLSERKTQPTIDSFFFKTAANQNPELFRSKRVNEALGKMTKRQQKAEEDVVNLTEDEEDQDSDSVERQVKAPPKGRKTKKSASTSAARTKRSRRQKN